jgi:hypothetical protein
MSEGNVAVEIREPVKRACAECGAEDRAVVMPGEVGDGGGPVYDHHVRIDLRFIAKEYVPLRLQAKGWQYGFIQARHAMFRFLCRDCIAKAYERDEVWQEQRTIALQAEGKKQKSFYNILCEE